MAATSLAEQLQRLKVPQATIYKDGKTKASLLFDPKEAGHKDRDTFYEIGRSGLEELSALYEGFRLYEDTLFSLSSKEFERAVQSKEVNQNLDQTIEAFLLQLSPYLLIQSSHKALEWLVNRYHIHQYNQDAIMALILPYHETKIFIRFVQIMDLTSSRWSWLEPIKKNGITLTKQVLYNHCTTKCDVLQFISKMTLKYAKVFGERASQLNTVFAFFCSAAVGTIKSSKKVTEAIMNSILPTIVKGLDYPIIDFRASSLIVLGFLVTKANLKKDTFNTIVSKLLTTEYDLSYDMVLVINLMYSNQRHITYLSEEVLNDLSVDVMNVICGHFKKIVEQKISVQAFIMAFFSSILPVILRDGEEFRKFSQLPQILIDEVDFKAQQPELIIKCVLDLFKPGKEDCIADGDESDLEIVEEDGFLGKVFMWYSTLLKNLEVKYPIAFDKVIKTQMSSDGKFSSKRRKQLSKILGFKPAVAHKVGDTYLFENLNHINPQLRVQAVEYIANEFESLKNENVDFLKDSIITRLGDDNPAVVAAALAIPSQHLEEVLKADELSNAFKTIVSKKSKKWTPVIRDTVIKFCSLKNFPVNQDTVLSLVPYLFPNDQQSCEITWNILNSAWGNKLQLNKKIKGLKKPVKNNFEVLGNIVFKALFVDRELNFDDILTTHQLNKGKTLDICIYLLLKTCTFKVATVETLNEVLSVLLESVESRNIVHSSIEKPFSPEIMSEFIQFAKQDKILFEIMEYIFSRIIEDMNISDIPKPWCNVCERSDVVLVRKLIEISITGCSIPSYAENYAKLLKNLLSKLFQSTEDKFNFIANIAFGHIFYATDPKNVISPELQLKSLKLLNNFLAVQENSVWLYGSDVVILMVIFNLTNPLAAIRQCTMDFVNKMLIDCPDKSQLYIQLLKEILEHKEELLLDPERINHVLYNTLAKADPGTKLLRKNCLQKLMIILSSKAPAYIKSNFIKVLSNFTSASAFPGILAALNKLEVKLKQNTLDKHFALDIYESTLMKNAYSFINEATISTLSKEPVWESISIALKEYRECVLGEDQTFTSPCVLVLKQIDEDAFKKVPEEKVKQLVHLITSAGAFSNNPTISSAASKVMKKIHLKFADFKSILDGMINVKDPGSSVSKKKKTAVSMLSYQLTETPEWRLGVTLLEYVQSKKKMTVDNSFALILFQLLNKCLRFEEQSYVEYTKQLILSSLWYYCKKFVDDTDVDQMKSLKSMFDVELTVQCIRGTQNPQTHHHALILLSHAAYMMPEQVLHHTMEVFTFMGTSVLRHDDAYSFQIISKIIETLIPILVKLDRNVEEYTEKELRLLQNRVVPVLRIFADVVLHVPEHRRLPLYKKLLDTLGASQFLWIFLGLLLETHVAHFKDSKKKDKSQKRSLADQEDPINRVDFGQSLLLEFPPEVCLENFIRLILYIKTLPLQKDPDSMDTDVDPSDIFSVNGHTPMQLRHYKYAIITFMNTCLASSRFIQHFSNATDTKSMEGHFKTFIVNILTFIQSISKVTDEKTSYWRVMLHHSYDLLDHTNNLLSAPMFLSVVRGLLKHTLVTVRRKSMELLNSKIQFSPEMFENVDKELLYALLPPLLDIIKTIETTDESLTETAAQEQELNQQTALLSLKLLTRMLASNNPEPFKPVLECVTEYTCNPNIPGNVMASVVLCLAELCTNLKAHALASLRKFMPALIKVLKKQRKVETPELILLSTVTAISKVIESVPLFLSPYLQKILYEFSILLAKWQNSDQDHSRVSAIVSKLGHIKKKIASSIPPRVLIPVANETHQLLLEKENYDAIGPVMSVLADSFANVTTADFTALQHDLTEFFLTALQLRSNAVGKNIDPAVIDRAEGEVVNALVSLVLKLSETSFRPFYFKLYDWAIRTNVEGHKDRTITFYRLSSVIADKLKGLFVLFAGHFIKNAADLLDACNNSKTEELYFDSEEKCILLVNYIIKTLHIVFMYDSQSFVNKDRFEALMQPVVDQLENTIGGIEGLKKRAKESLTPCISQFAVATGDDSLWKLLNYQILLKIRHNDADVRLTALDCLVAMASQLGSSWLPLLAESVPFLAELLEDADSRIEESTKNAIRTLEQILGEPLDKYF